MMSSDTDVRALARFTLESALEVDSEARDAMVARARDALTELVRECEGSVPRAAARLGVTRQTVYNYLNRLGIDPAPYRRTRRRGDS